MSRHERAWQISGIITAFAVVGFILFTSGMMIATAAW